MKIPSNNTVFNLFNYKRYLYFNNIHFLFNIDNIEKIKSSNKLRYNIKQFIIDHINNIKYSSTYLNLFILGENSNLNKDILENYRFLGISHLFAVSGMHISILSLILLKLLKSIKVTEFYRYLIAIIFILFYMFLTDYSPSILRAAIFFILLSINKYYYFHIKTINLLLLTLIINIFINPYIIYNVGFQFSYIISLYLVLFQDLIIKQTNYFLNLLVVSFIAFLTSLPISIYNFFQFNLLSIIYNLIFVPLVSTIVFPLSLIVFIFPFLDKILYIFIKLMEYLAYLFSRINTNIILAKPNLLVILIYYILITFILYSFKKGIKKRVIYLILLIFIHYSVPYFNKNTYLTMIDVGQGDSILIRLPHNKGNILIDTGGKSNYKEEWQLKGREYSLGRDTLIPYFKSLGLTKIEYLIITHGDFDHMGEATNLINNYNVKNVILNCGKYNDLEQELIKVLEKKKIKYHSCINELDVDNNKLYFLNTKEYDNENDNSSVIYTELNNYKFLFMGDASTEVEKEIIKKYNISDINFLKVGHHGSYTSSSKEFIDSIKPKYSLISVGKNNRFGHPKNSVLNILKDSKIYRTDEDGSIEIKLTKNGYENKTCSP